MKVSTPQTKLDPKAQRLRIVKNGRFCPNVGGFTSGPVGPRFSRLGRFSVCPYLLAPALIARPFFVPTRDVRLALM